MDVAEIFVVRIYRGHAGAPDGFVGVVDLIGAETRRAFSSFEELVAILRDSDYTPRKITLFLVDGKGKWSIVRLD